MSSDRPVSAARVVASPLGTLTLTATPAGLAGVAFGASGHPASPGGGRVTEVVLDAVADQLAHYFHGNGAAFGDIPLDLRTVTDFTAEVLHAMRRIPFGALRTYGELAEEVRRPGGAQAVGRACGANPVPIVVPCHRVVASDGTLGGYTGGLAIKRRLLQIERPGAIPTGGWLVGGDRDGADRQETLF